MRFLFDSEWPLSIVLDSVELCLYALFFLPYSLFKLDYLLIFIGDLSPTV